MLCKYIQRSSDTCNIDVMGQNASVVVNAVLGCLIASTNGAEGQMSKEEKLDKVHWAAVII